MRCDYYEADLCRSCAWLPRTYERQLADKTEAARRLLPEPTRGWSPSLESPQARFRNKAKFAVGGSIEAPLLGIPALAGPPGAITDLSACPLYLPAIEAALGPLRAFITRARLLPYDVATRRGELKHLLVTASPRGDLMVRFVMRSREAEARLRKHLPTLLEDLPALRVVSLNLLPEHAALTEGREEIALHGSSLTMEVAGLALHLLPQSFFQTNTAIADALYREAAAWLADLAPRSLWDLYCGVGGFALSAALAVPGLDVLGVEISPEAIASARRSARDLGLDRVRFVAGDAGMIHDDEGRAPGVVVVNPPRRGIGEELATWLEASDVDAVIYSSCNPTTLARDLAAMPSLRLERARLLDMFPNTAHAEVLTLLRRAA